MRLWNEIELYKLSLISMKRKNIRLLVMGDGNLFLILEQVGKSSLINSIIS